MQLIFISLDPPGAHQSNQQSKLAWLMAHKLMESPLSEPLSLGLSQSPCPRPLVRIFNTARSFVPFAMTHVDTVLSNVCKRWAVRPTRVQHEANGAKAWWRWLVAWRWHAVPTDTSRACRSADRLIRTLSGPTPPAVAFLACAHRPAASTAGSRKISDFDKCARTACTCDAQTSRCTCNQNSHFNPDADCQSSLPGFNFYNDRVGYLALISTL